MTGRFTLLDFSYIELGRTIHLAPSMFYGRVTFEKRLNLGSWSSPRCVRPFSPATYPSSYPTHASLSFNAWSPFFVLQDPSPLPRLFIRICALHN